MITWSKYIPEYSHFCVFFFAFRTVPQKSFPVTRETGDEEKEDTEEDAVAFPEPLESVRGNGDFSRTLDVILIGCLVYLCLFHFGIWMICSFLWVFLFFVFCFIVLDDQRDVWSVVVFFGIWMMIIRDDCSVFFLVSIICLMRVSATHPELRQCPGKCC